MVFSTLVFASALSAKLAEPVHSPYALFANFREMDEVISVSILPFLLNWDLGMARIFSKDPQIDIGGVRSLVPLGLLKNLETICVATTEDAEIAKQMKKMFGEFIEKSGFSELVRETREKTVYIQVKENSAHFLISDEERRGFSVV